MTIKHHYQPTGNTCGPTCLYMVLEYFKSLGDSFGYETPLVRIEVIAEICGTDWIVGTPPDRMEKGMKILNINYIEYVCTPRPFETIHKILDEENIAILRTIKQGIPHWIIVSGYDKDKYTVLDPAEGENTWNEKELDEIWKLRQYQFFEIINPWKSK